MKSCLCRTKSSVAGSAVAFAFLLAATATIGAQPGSGARLSFHVAEGSNGCGSTAELRAAVASRLGYDPFRDDSERTLSVAVHAVGRSLEADLRMVGAQGEVLGTRTIRSPAGDCAELMASLSLAAGLVLDPRAALAPIPATSPSASPSSTSSLPAPTANKSAPGQESAPAASRPVPQISVGPVVGWGFAPSMSWGASARASIRWATGLSLGLEGRADLPATSEMSANGRVQSRLIAATVLPCLHTGISFVCALISLGAMHGSGVDVERVQRDTTLYAASGARAGGEVRLSPTLCAAVHADLTTTLRRTTLKLDDQDVWTSPPVAVALGLSVGGNFQ